MKHRPCVARVCISSITTAAGRMSGMTFAARVQATVRCLADNGRLLEIGKYDILKGTPLSMRPMLRNCAFEGIDLDRIVNDPSNITEVCA